MAPSLLPVSRQTAIGAAVLLFFIWTLTSFSGTTRHYHPVPAGGQIFHQPAGPGDGSKHVPVAKPAHGDKSAGSKTDSASSSLSKGPSAKENHSTTGKAPAKSAPKSPTAGLSPSKDSASSSPGRETDRPLILYAYAETETTRENLAFFLNQGLHGGADFVFVLIGETNVTDLIPTNKPNVRIVSRPETCSDLGAFSEVLRKDNLWKKYGRFITLNASIRGPFLPWWSDGCWSDVLLRRLNDKVKLIGMTANCYPEFHVQSMIWATDSTGMALLLENPPPPKGKREYTARSFLENFASKRLFSRTDIPSDNAHFQPFPPPAPPKDASAHHAHSSHDHPAPAPPPPAPASPAKDPSSEHKKPPEKHSHSKTNSSKDRKAHSHANSPKPAAQEPKDETSPPSKDLKTNASERPRPAHPNAPKHPDEPKPEEKRPKENLPVGFALNGCHATWTQAAHARVGATPLLRHHGYAVDLLMMAFHDGVHDYAATCDTSVNGDVLWPGRYYGANVHPYETLFMRTNRGVEPKLLEKLTEWHLSSGRTSWDTCKH